jgi:hypothetical protein
MKQNKVIFIVVVLVVCLFLVMRKRQANLEETVTAGLNNSFIPTSREAPKPVANPKISSAAIKQARTSVAIQIRDLPSQIYLGERLSPYVEIKGAEAKPLDVALLIRNGPTDTFATGTNMRRSQRGVAAFSGLSFKLPGTYDIYALAGDEKSSLVTVKVSIPPPRQVRILIDGKEFSGRFEYPDKYVLPDGDTYEKVYVGQTIAVIDGVKYKVVRAYDNSLSITTQKKD